MIFKKAHKILYLYIEMYEKYVVVNYQAQTSADDIKLLLP